MKMPTSDPELCAKITTLTDSNKYLSRNLNKLTTNLDAHITESKASMKDVSDKIDELSKAFPDGTEHHREVHQAMIDAKKAETEFYVDLKQTVIKRGLLGAVVVLFGLLWLGAEEWIKLHLGFK